MPGAQLKPRKDGRYIVKYKGHNFYGYTQQEAMDKRDEYKAAESRGEICENPNLLFSTYAWKWLEVYKANITYRSRIMYKPFIDRACAAFGDRKIKDIRSMDIANLYNTMEGYSDTTCEKMALTMNSIFEAAIADCVIYRNPCKGVARPKGPEGTHRCLEDWEKELVLESARANDHRFSLAAATMLLAGLRKGEALALDIDRDVDFHNNVIHVRRALVYNRNQPDVSTPKTEAGIRDVPLLPQLKEILQGHHGLLCSTLDGRYVTITVYQQLIAGYNINLSRKINKVSKRWCG